MSEDRDLSELYARLDAINENLLVMTRQLYPPPPNRPSQVAVANAQGIATVAFPVIPGGVNNIWQVEKVFVGAQASTGGISTAASPQVVVYTFEGAPAGADLNNPNGLTTLIPFMHGVDSTNLKVAGGDEINPFPVKGGEAVWIQWSSMNSGDVCAARLQIKMAYQGLETNLPSLAALG